MSDEPRHYMKITWEDGTVTEFVGPPQSLLFMAGNGTLDWLIDAVDKGRETEP